MIALTQARIHPGARDYIARHRAEGKSSAEALRALKRHLARCIFRLFKAMHAAAAAGDLQHLRPAHYGRASDLIDGIIRLAESGLHHPVNIGNPNEFTLLELAEQVIEITGSRSEIIHEALLTAGGIRRRSPHGPQDRLNRHRDAGRDAPRVARFSEP